MTFVQDAVIFAAKAHFGQDRKYTGLPYITHPIEVMRIVSEVEFATPHMLAAAVLHDVVEDTPVSLNEIQLHFGITVTELVECLTDEFTNEKYPYFNRAERKVREAMRLAEAPIEARIIKTADLISNTSSIVKHDPGFAKVYLQEKQHALQLIGEEDNPLWARAWELATQEIEA